MAYAGTNGLGVWKRPLGELTDVSKENFLPNEFALFQNYPNPFNPTTLIRYLLPVQGYVTLKVYNVLGREVEMLVSENQSAGTHSVNFNAKGLSSGVYLYRLSSGSFQSTKKLIIMK
jgi:hypothetical protein